MAAPLPAAVHRNPPTNLPMGQGRVSEQAEQGWKNGLECVAGEPGAYLGLRLGINWETR